MINLKKEKIIIIGAGVAGMTPAQLLQKKGFENAVSRTQARHAPFTRSLTKKYFPQFF